VGNAQSFAGFEFGSQTVGLVHADADPLQFTRQIFHVASHTSVLTQA
jgi:hypothetical protein